MHIGKTMLGKLRGKLWKWNCAPVTLLWPYRKAFMQRFKHRPLYIRKFIIRLPVPRIRSACDWTLLSETPSRKKMSCRIKSNEIIINLTNTIIINNNLKKKIRRRNDYILVTGGIGNLHNMLKAAWLAFRLPFLGNLSRILQILLHVLKSAYIKGGGSVLNGSRR